MSSLITKVNNEKWVFSDFFGLQSTNTTTASYATDDLCKQCQYNDPLVDNAAISITDTPILDESKYIPDNITNNKKSKKKKKKTEKKSKCIVQFSNVELILFSRCVGASVIPSSGGWPLGLGQERLSIETFKLDDYETLKIQSNYHMNNITSKTSTGKASSELDILELDERLKLLNLVQHKVDVVDSDANLLNQEVEAIQKSRKIDKGCQCKPIKIDKLSIPRLKCELLKSGCEESSIKDLNKTQLSKKLRDILSGKNCQICVDTSCPCVQNEHNCNAAVCECLKKSVKESSCSNPFGKFICDSNRIQMCREKHIGVKSHR